ncbi:amidohydrolase [Kordiimonas sediminis]|uniref:Amidohydrolase n=1 Tax=Kordiimonas sediminis TaxID=1735581 RepID=A0A919AZ94_9PROT|nr:amidohydrolase family protein [Kordiimonas sediminis]GHF30908.1 amidohydrolase [Kordiimonas sediminis]
MKIHSFLKAGVAAITLLSATHSAANADVVKPGDEALVSIEKMGLQLPRVASPLDPAVSQGPFKRMVIRGATLIDGTGAPPVGPVDIVVEGNRIKQIAVVGNPGVAINESRRPAKGDYEIDAHGKYILPGFVDTHSHMGSPGWGLTGKEMPPMDYVLKLWLSHGITTTREVGCGLGADYTIKEKARAAKNEIASPRILAHCFFPSEMETAEEARAWARGLKKRGADGIKFGGGKPEVLEAAIDEAQKIGLKTAFHHAQISVTRVNVLDSARWGLDSMEHWYGLPEALFDDRQVQDYPVDYNYMNEQDRFGQAGRLWKQAAKPGSEKWNAVMDELLALDFTLSPTLTIYEANRDVMRAVRNDYHDEYTLPSISRFFQPNRVLHGSYHFDWTTQDEIEWKNNYKLWMAFLNEYKNRGGRVTTGSDSGFIFNLFGFGYVRELELLQEAGFHPFEVVKAATLNGAELVGLEKEIGSVEPGKIADLVIVDENPARNFKVLYGNGHMKLNDETNKVERVGGVRYTIKDGIVHDAVLLREEIKQIVRDAKAEEAKNAD